MEAKVSTLARNANFRSNGSKKGHSVREWRRRRKFCTVNPHTFVHFLDPETQKEPFHARVVKAEIVLHCKINAFEQTPDQKCQFSEPKYADLPLKKISAFATLARNCQFWSGACPKPCILRCKTTFAFTTLARNGSSCVSGSKK